MYWLAGSSVFYINYYKLILVLYETTPPADLVTYQDMTLRYDAAQVSLC